MIIDEFIGPYRWLSNFTSNTLGYNVEIEYQALKAMTLEDYNLIKNCCNPSEAKALGKKIKIRPDWESVKLYIMESLVWNKFQDPVFGQKLTNTGDAMLIEGNWWGDRYWGVCKGVGANHLGKILMNVRERLKNER